jgi:predicted metal-dependent HD superfamily phosphohydrolase
MNDQRFQSAADYAIDLLQRKLLPAFTYHSVDHTLEVVSQCGRLAELEGINDEHRNLLLLAAYFHEVGLTEISKTDLDAFEAGRSVHEQKAVEVAREVLPRYGFGPEELETITRLIMATKWGHRPSDVLEQIISDADMSSLGQTIDQFMHISEILLAELRAFGNEIEEVDWYENQKELVGTYTFHTASAHSLFDANKLLNTAAVQSHLDVLRSQ